MQQSNYWLCAGAACPAADHRESHERSERCDDRVVGSRPFMGDTFEFDLNARVDIQVRYSSTLIKNRN